jgi:hypothetical protein
MHETTVKTEDTKLQTIGLQHLPFLPNKNIGDVQKLLAKENEERSPIIYSRSAYGTDKSHVSSEQTKEFKYPLVHTTPKDGIRYSYSSTQSGGHFGIPKVIFGDSGINQVLIDINGKYGMTQHAMAIQISSEEEALLIENALKSIHFQNILEACMWSNFQIDWRLFTYFKKDWYKEILKTL